MRALSGQHWLVLAVLIHITIVLLTNTRATEARHHKKNHKSSVRNHHNASNKHHHSSGVSAKDDKKDQTHHHHHKKHKSHHKQHGHDHGKKHPPPGDPDFIAKDLPDVRCAVPGLGACPADRPCCSKWGWCGNTADHCGEGCQPQYGTCSQNGPNAQQGRPKAQFGNQLHHWSDRFNRKQRPIGPGSPPNPFWIANRGIPKMPSATDENRRLLNIGYFAGWTQYRGRENRACQQRPYLPSAIPWSSLDYVMFAFAYFDDAGELYPADPADEALYFQINELKMGTNTRVLLSIGGWGFTHPSHAEVENTQPRFENMVRTPETRRQFIESCIAFCEYYGFDGIDIDWEYPSRGVRSQVTLLFQELRRAFDSHGHGLVLTIAGGSFRDSVQGYEFDKLTDAIDFFMIMAYDLYGAYDPSGIVNIHTSLFQMPTEHHQGHSVQGAVELYIDLGVPRHKIVLGMALYGKTFTLANQQQTAPGYARFRAAGPPTDCVESPGDIAYNEIAAVIRHNPAALHWDSNARAFYFVYGQGTWVGYDDRSSVDLKLQLVAEHGLAGIMWWSLDQDLDRTSAWPGASNAKRRDQSPLMAPVAPRPAAAVAAVAPAPAPTILAASTPSDPANHRPGEKMHAAAAACPQLVQPPAHLTTLPLGQLGQPGLVVYAAQKRSHCPVRVQLPLALPRTPLGNTVFVKCPVIPGCPVLNNAYQAYTCTPQGWSQPSQCYAKASLAPTSYFFGELQLVRTARDRDEPGAATSSTQDPPSKHGHGPRPRPHNPLDDMVGSRPPQSIEALRRENRNAQWLKDHQQRPIQPDDKQPPPRGSSAKHP